MLTEYAPYIDIEHANHPDTNIFQVTDKFGTHKILMHENITVLNLWNTKLFAFKEHKERLEDKDWLYHSNYFNDYTNLRVVNLGWNNLTECPWRFLMALHAYIQDELWEWGYNIRYKHFSFLKPFKPTLECIDIRFNNFHLTLEDRTLLKEWFDDIIHF
jgi:hypothetical protein